MPERTISRDIEFTVPETINHPLGSIEAHLKDIFADRLRVDADPASSELTEHLELSAQEFTNEQVNQLKQNLQLLKLLSGQRGSSLRKLAGQANGEAASFLDDLYKWSAEAASGRAKLASSPLFAEPPPLLVGVQDNAEQLYERLRFSQFHIDIKAENYEQSMATATADAIGLPKDSKWVDMVEPLFRGPGAARNVEEVLLHVGYIPAEIYTKRKFKSIEKNDAAQLISTLRNLEQTELREEARTERVKALKFIFVSGKALEFKGGKANSQKENNVTLDSNGIFINLSEIHSHVPYGLLDSQFITALENGGWLSRGEILEARSQNLKANSEFSEKQQIDEIQIQALAAGFGIKEADQERAQERLVENILMDPDKFAFTVFEQGLIVPDAFLSRLLKDKKFSAAYSVFRFGESIATNITGETLRRRTKLLSSYDILHEKQQAYESREGILNNPKYYNALKAARTFLENPVPSDPDEEFVLLRGDYKKDRGDQHSFIEVIYQAKVARILINTDKNLESRQTKNLQGIELYDRENYEQLEDAVRTFDYFSGSLNSATKVLQEQGENWQQRFLDYSETLLHFILSNVGKHYWQANILEENLRHGSGSFIDQADALIKICQQAKQEYSNFFYNNIGQSSDFAEKFSSEVSKTPVVFNNDFLISATKSCVPNGYDPQICLSNFPVNVVELDYSVANPSQTIPYNVEEFCLDALRISRNKPLINVVGGCARLDRGKGEDPLRKFADAVADVGHRYKANIGVPGTQSGIGVTFGQKNIEYTQDFSSLPFQERAHFFGITPGRNLFFPGNKFKPLAPGEDVYAITSVDSIVTPQSAGWDVKGLNKLHSPYLNHIAIMEALYARMSKDQPRVMAVGNGGVFTIAEVNESLKRGFGMLLIRDTGRFADAAAAVLPALDDLPFYDRRELSEQIIKLVESNMNPVFIEEFLKKDFGITKDADNDEHLAYREFFTQFLLIAKKFQDNIKITSLDSLEPDLETYLASQVKNR